MNICVFDTETTSLEKPFCYNVGYIIVNLDTLELLVKKDFVVEQVWYNKMLFSTAYYATKRLLYVSSMRARTTKMDKYGYIMQEMNRDLKKHNVQYAYAYNASFDIKVFEFNTDWYKCVNPLDTIPIYDIRGFAHNFLCGDSFKDFCERNDRFTESGNYSTTAETVYQFITQDKDFIESHTALSDSFIELKILLECMRQGADLTVDYKAFRSIDRIVQKELFIKFKNNFVFSTIYERMTKKVKDNQTTIYLK